MIYTLAIDLNADWAGSRMKGINTTFLNVKKKVKWFYEIKNSIELLSKLLKCVYRLQIGIIKL